MIDYHIALKLVYREHLRRVVERDVRMFGSVGICNSFVRFAVVKEEIMQQSGTRCGLCVKAEETAQKEIVVGHVQRVLKPRRAVVMSEFAQTQHGVIVKQVAYTAVIVVDRGEVFFGEHSSEHNKITLQNLIYIYCTFFSP